LYLLDSLHLEKNMSHTLLQRCLFNKYKHLVRFPVNINNNVIINQFTTCTVLRCSDEYKSDPDVKKFMRKISEDFDKIENVRKDDSEVISDKIAEDKEEEIELKDTVAVNKKGLEDLLSELYSEDEKSTVRETSGLGGYSKFKDSDAEIIYDVDEERRILREAADRGEDVQVGKKKTNIVYKYDYMAAKRGNTGVFDAFEVVQILKDEKIKDIAVMKIPKERKYADYLLIGTGRNGRHLYVVSQIIRKLYKMKMCPSDPDPQIEGATDKGKSGWIAMDMGNLVLHLFQQEKRDYYSLETLWVLGPEFDNISQEQETDPLAQLMALNIDPELCVNNNDNQEVTSLKQTKQVQDGIR